MDIEVPGAHLTTSGYRLVSAPPSRDHVPMRLECIAIEFSLGVDICTAVQATSSSYARRFMGLCAFAPSKGASLKPAPPSQR